MNGTALEALKIIKDEGLYDEECEPIFAALSRPSLEDAIKIMEKLRAGLTRDVYPEYDSLVCHYDGAISALKARLPK